MTYRYALLNRPAGIGTIPKNLDYTVESRPNIGADHHTYARHGILVTERALTKIECSDYELIAIIERNSWAEGYLVELVVNSMFEYRVDYLELYKTNLQEFKDVVNEHLGRFSVGNDFHLKVLTWLAGTS